VREPDTKPPERLRFQGESYVRDADIGNRHRGIPVVRAETYNALVHQLERMRREESDPTAVYKATTEPRYTSERREHEST
jgi:hypothetical protein